MARRKKQGLAEDLLDMVALLPWWAGVALGLASYFVLHALSVPKKAGPVDPARMGDFVLTTLLSTFAYFGQFIVPLICIVGALVSFLQTKRRAALLANVTQSSGAEVLHGMSWQEFELLVAEAFRIQGYAVTSQGGAASDGGVDAVLRKGSETFLVQCKQWKAYKVSVDVVRELYGVMAARGAAGGFVVTSGSFTKDARAFADGRNIRLVDGPKLVGLIHQARAARAERPQPDAKRPPPPAAAFEASPSCPTCTGEMVRRTARKGANAGAQFWGCANYPACRGTRQGGYAVVTCPTNPSSPPPG